MTRSVETTLANLVKAAVADLPGGWEIVVVAQSPDSDDVLRLEVAGNCGPSSFISMFIQVIDREATKAGKPTLSERLAAKRVDR